MTLKPKKYTKNSSKVHKIFGFDVETYGEYNTFYMGSVYSDEGPKVFYNKDNMKRYLNSKYIYKRKHYVVATNLMFDFFALYDYKELDNFSFIFRGSELITCHRIFKEHKSKQKRRIKYIDTFHIATKMSLANLGKIIGLHKLPSPTFIGEIPTLEPYVSFLDNKKTYNQKEYLEKYNIRDSEITYKFTKFYEEGLIEMGAELKPTIASISLNYFRLKYLKDSYKTPKHIDCEFMFKGYYGGRTEALKRGKINNINYYDINSLYPSVMLKDFPDPNALVTVNQTCKYYIINHEGLAKVKIKTPTDIKIPLLPFRTKDKLLFPVGTFVGTYTHLELRKALTLGYEIIEYYGGHYYTNTISIFKDFVEDNYNKRLELKKDKNPMEYTVKIILNSLYGKFGQRYDKKQEITFVDMFDFSEKNINKYEEVEVLKEYFVITKELCEKPPEFIQPIWSIYVTAYGRLELYKLFEKVGFNNVFYCDTDSVFTSQKLLEGNKLGELKLEYFVKSGLIIKPKFYEINGKVKAKGLAGFNKKENLLQLIEEGKFETTKFCKFKETLRRIDDLRVNQKIKIIKKVSFEDTKRIWEHPEFSTEYLQDSLPLEVIEVSKDKYEVV